MNGGLTPSNTVYVDDVVDNIMLAIKEDNAVGHALIISSDQNTSWKEFFSHYAKMFSSPPALLNITLNELKRERDRQYLELLKKVFSNPKQNAHSIPTLAAQSPFISSLIPLIDNSHIKSRINELIPSIVKRVTLAKTDEVNKGEHTMNKIPNFWMEKTFTLPFSFPIKGAAEILGFKPRVSLEEGMKKIKDWLVDWSAASFVSPLETYAVSDLIVSELARPKCAR
jgi:nucleoside-diphosphate-sugar epimerase